MLDLAGAPITLVRAPEPVGQSIAVIGSVRPLSAKDTKTASGVMSRPMVIRTRDRLDPGPLNCSQPSRSSTFAAGASLEPAPW